MWSKDWLLSICRYLTKPVTFKWKRKMDKEKTGDVKPIDPKEKINIEYLYSSYATRSPLYGVCSRKNFRIGTMSGCREVLCGSVKTSYRTAAHDKYLLIHFCSERFKENVFESPQIKRLIKNIKVLNELERRLALEPTTVEVATWENIVFTTPARKKQFEKSIKATKTVPIVCVAYVDEIWMSAPSILSFHSAMMRLYDKFDADTERMEPSYDALRKRLSDNSLKSADKRVLRLLDEVVFLLSNLLEVFPEKRTYKDNWFYAGFQQTDGINGFMSIKKNGNNWTIPGGRRGDIEAMKNFYTLYHKQ